MKKITFDVPSLYGDHHVTEVRKLLQNIQGVDEVYASSAFRMVEVTYDPSKVNDLDIQIILDEAGYLGEWTIPSEFGRVVESRGEFDQMSRHSSVYESTRQVTSFSQTVTATDRPLWNCPGMGVITSKLMLEKMEE